MNTVACPRCEGAKMIDNGARDPQDRDDTECPRCDATGRVRAPQLVEPLGGVWKAALDGSIAEARRLRDEEARRDAEQQRQVDRLLQQELAERDREWWS